MRRIVVLLQPGCRLGGLEALRDLVSMTQAYAGDLFDAVEQVQPVALSVASVDGKAVVSADGRRIAVDGALSDAAIDSLYIADFTIPAVGAWRAWLEGHPRDLARISAAASRASTVAGAGAGVVLALEAGLGRGGPVAAAPLLVEHIRRGRRTRIDPTQVVVEAGDLLTTAGLGGEAMLALKLLERAVTPHLAGVLARRASLSLTTDPDRDSFAVPVLKADDLVARACERLKDRFSQTVGLAAFAVELGVTLRTLNRRFQASLGMGPKAYQQHLRLASACSMLERTSRPVARISAMVGYSDTSYFTDLFQRRLGLSPSAFRRRARQNSHAR